MANNDVAIIEVNFNESGPEMVSFRRSSSQINQKTPDSDKQLNSSERFMVRSFVSTTKFYENDQQLKDNIQVKIKELRHKPSQDEEVVYEKENVIYCQSKNLVENKVEMTEFLNSEPENDESDNDGSKNKIESQNIKKSKKKYNACGFNYLMEIAYFEGDNKL